MKTLFSLLLTLGLPLTAQEIKQSSSPIDRDQLMSNLMNATDARGLQKALAAAKQGGLPEQMLLEAQFLFLINENNLPALAALGPKLEKHLPSFSPDRTLIFAVKEDFESVLHYSKALDALLKKDTVLFKKHITEAFWLGPDHAAQFAPHIKKLRMENAMTRLVLDLERPFEDQREDTQKKSLSDLQGKAPALLIHFWSPWVQQSILTMPEFAKAAKPLLDNGIPVASFLITSTSESRKDADQFLTTEGQNLPGAWLVDTAKSPLSSSLRVSTFPTVVLVNKKGGILFNGDPADPALWKELARINPKIKAPAEDLVLPDGLSEDKIPEKTGKE